MNLRELIDKNPKVGYAVAGALGSIAIATVFTQVRGSHGNPPGISTKAYYTTDDQLTGAAALDALFVEDVDEVPPFDHDGKPAYLAIVMSSNGGRTRWVNDLKRFTPSVKSKVEAYIADMHARGFHSPIDTADFEFGAEYKAPGVGSWVRGADPKAGLIRGCQVPQNASADDVMPAVP